MDKPSIVSFEKALTTISLWSLLALLSPTNQGSSNHNHQNWTWVGWTSLIQDFVGCYCLFSLDTKKGSKRKQDNTQKGANTKNAEKKGSFVVEKNLSWYLKPSFNMHLVKSFHYSIFFLIRNKTILIIVRFKRRMRGSSHKI